MILDWGCTVSCKCRPQKEKFTQAKEHLVGAMQALRQCLRKGRSLQQCRGLASAAVEVAPPGEDSPFLRFASPLPRPQDHTSVLGSIPETKVRSGDIHAGPTH